MEETANYISFKHPKLLRIKQPPQVSSNNQSDYDFEKKNLELKQRIHKLNKIHRENKEEQDQYELNRRLISFYKNPFNYMEYLAKKYFIENANTLENLKIKQDINYNFQKLCYQIEDQIRNYTANKERKLNELEKLVENKLKGGSIPFGQDDIESENNKETEKYKNINLNNKHSNNLQSSPMTIDDQEFLNRVIGNQGIYGSSPMDGIITNGNAANYVINNKISNLNEDNLYINALSCLKGDKLVVPKNKFIAVKELSINDIDQKMIKDTQNINDLKYKMKIEEYNNQIIGKNNDKNNKKIKNKINNLKQKEKKNLEDLISYSNNYLNNMKQIQNEKKDLINYVKKKLNQEFEANAIKLAMNKLSVCEQNLNQIKSDKYYNNNIPENSLTNWDERKEMLEKEFQDTQTMVNNFLNGRGASLSKHIKKGNKNTNKKKKRNNSAIPYNRKNYNYTKKY